MIRNNTKFVELRQNDLKKKFDSVTVDNNNYNPPMRFTGTSKHNMMGFFSTVASMSPLEKDDFRLPATRSPSKFSIQDNENRAMP